MDVGNHLRALMRDMAWGFFYGWVSFDQVVGTVNKYTSVDLYAGSCKATIKTAGVDLVKNFPTEQIRATFEHRGSTRAMTFQAPRPASPCL
jgi:hypothetical protein